MNYRLVPENMISGIITKNGVAYDLSTCYFGMLDEECIQYYFDDIQYRLLSENMVCGIITKNGVAFDLSTCDFGMLDEVDTQYCYDDIQEGDVVLDIGANIGAFSLRIKDMVSHVYSVEPLFVSELRKNIELNNASEKIKILPYALGSKNLVLKYNEKKGYTIAMSLSEIINMCGGHVDFLKLDCEGGEWCIVPDDLKGIRRIEAEVHSFNGEKFSIFTQMLEESGYYVNIGIRSDETIMIHAFYKKKCKNQ